MRLTLSQVAALARLRWQMVRSDRVRAALVLGAVLTPVVLAGAVAAGATLAATPGAPTDAGPFAPALFAALAAISVLAPLSAGGGYPLVPEESLVAHPVRPATIAVGSLLLSPLNVTWLAHVVGVATATGYLTGTGPRLAPAVATTLAYVALTTAAGAALAWTIVGIRARRGGRLALAVAGGAGAVGVGAVVGTGSGRAALDALPTSAMLPLLDEAGAGSLAVWAAGFAGLVLGAAVAVVLAVRACGWALTRRADRAGAGLAVPVRRRGPRRTAFAELVAVDRASVWRAPALRRGVVLLTVVPGAAALIIDVEWSSIAMLPPIVAAGTGLLFGINVFCLDAGGATWLATLPHDPRTAYLAKVRVLTELCLLTSGATVLLSLGRAPAPTGAEVAAVAGALVVGTATVVATCLTISVHRPHRADLRGPRDTPAPPGALFADTLLLSVAATVTGSMFAVLSLAPAAWLPLAVAAALTLAAVGWVRRGAQRWREPTRRARVVAAVAGG